MNSTHISILEWFVRLITLRPHMYLGGEEDPYMLRWYLIPRNRWMNLYLHCFLRDDADRELHDHPWWFRSFILWGSYSEIVEDHQNGGTKYIYRKRWSYAYRPAVHRHRVILDKDYTVYPTMVPYEVSPGKVAKVCTWPPIPCWTLVLTGPKEREWGFWCPKGRFVPWHIFVHRSKDGVDYNIGGCGDDT